MNKGDSPHKNSQRKYKHLDERFTNWEEEIKIMEEFFTRLVP